MGHEGSKAQRCGAGQWLASPASEGASVTLGWVPCRSTGDVVLQKINSGGNRSLCPLNSTEMNGCCRSVS